MVGVKLSSAKAAASVALVSVRMGLALGLCQSGGPKKGTDHEIHGEEAVAASPQAGVCQQAVDAVGNAPIKLQLPLHYLTLSVVQKKRALRDEMGRGSV